jgi:hypothetical protein
VQSEALLQADKIITVVDLQGDHRVDTPFNDYQAEIEPLPLLSNAIAIWRWPSETRAVCQAACRYFIALSRPVRLCETRE